ncbi:MAG TPA: hypothetical protein PLY42_15325 [Nitrospira sp.]|nr:hypothetical protein [Nitrospira sp.]MCW5796559.1 hypothetical protein [Nitrospira sp.]HMU31744.1 hypothetical protein [Nitrospira sp.]HMV57653.1 hypothetical protein [Nitrospira sp.]HMW87602.1 hypothetical protein [Nitrospira sp.]
MANQDETLKHIWKSGFPFQLKIEDEVRRTHSTHNWLIATREHPWTNKETESSGFIDLVLMHDHFVTYRMVIECKRVKADDRRQLHWLFLIPEGEKQETPLASCLQIGGTSPMNARIGEANVSQQEWDHVRIWENVNIFPKSFESSICVLPSDDSKSQPILERLAAGVIDSVEGLGDEEILVHQSQFQVDRLIAFLYPVIVTNAEIAICSFDPSKVSILDGTLDASAATITTVPFIRFRKSIATTFPEGTFSNLKEANEARELTVFVVNAGALPSLLTNWRMASRDLSGRYAIQNHLQR